MKRIVYTRKSDGGVSVCVPAAEAIAHLCSGGFWPSVRGFCEWQIEMQIARGVGHDAAQRYARAMVSGGCTTAEALAIIRDRDCAHLGTMIELFDIDDLPGDRWFRDAWTRSHNGGPVSVSLTRARRIQLERIKGAIVRRNGRRIELGREPITPAWGEIGNAIRHARDEHELRRVWPEGLPCPQ
jgi:hypothetical protein